MEIHVRKLENNFNNDNRIKDKRFSIFELTKMFFGIEILIIKEILPVSNITRIPNVQSFILGVFNLRGIITTLIDIRRIFNLKDSAVKSDHMIILIETDTVRFGILSERIVDIIPIEDSEIKKTDKRVSQQMLPYIDGVYHKEELGDIYLLDKIKISNILKSS